MEQKTPIELEFFIMNLDSLNEKHRKYSSELAQEWIGDLNDKKIKFYEIEYAINQDEKNLKTEYIKKSLYCGVVTSLRIDEEKKLYAKAKFKINGDFADEMYNTPDYFKELTLVPKGKGKIVSNTVCNYTLYGFNLIKSENSPFIKKEK